MALEALALECMNDRHREITAVVASRRGQMAKPCVTVDRMPVLGRQYAGRV